MTTDLQQQATLEEKLELFRKECESLDQLVEELFGELETVNLRLGHTAAQLEHQKQHIAEREQEWSQRQGEHEDLREFFVHQNDRIAHAIEKLDVFEQKLGDAPALGQADSGVMDLLAEMRDQQRTWQESRTSNEHDRQAELQQQLTQQHEQLSHVAEQLTALQQRLREVPELAEVAQPSPDLLKLLEDVHEQTAYLRERADEPPATGDEKLSDQFQRQEEQIASTLEQLAGFQEQLAELASSAVSNTAQPSEQLSELVAEIEAQRQQWQQQAESEQSQRAADHAALEAFFSRQGEQIEGTLDKLNRFEGMVQDLASAPPSNVPTEAELELRESEALAAANGRIAELEKTVTQQQQELLEERQLLREQVVELKDLLQLRTQSNVAPPETEPGAATASSNDSAEREPAEAPQEKSVLAQFAKLGKKN